MPEGETMQTIGNGLNPFYEGNFDGESDELAALRRKLAMENSELLDLLAVIFDAYEDGPQCYEAPEECSGFLGYAVRLDDATFQRTADILNERRPRVTPNA